MKGRCTRIQLYCSLLHGGQRVEMSADVVLTTHNGYEECVHLLWLLFD